ncbi:MAG: putative Myosin light chain kinase A [Streblomastix strix]|uniref:Putative Myosin light chain kinase A n=1 Tax=Streblomastix strix TaxID=222440 RepID=A0A5J4V6J5_9EUKA|nr:MAG: putative Myosin light chain kinase A [Streblomastix strix]
MEDLRLLESQNFQVLKDLGRGASGMVYLVNSPDTEIGLVAAKVIKNENFDANEWSVAGILDQEPCPFIIRNIAAKKFRDSTIILLEYANLGTLQDLIKTKIEIPIPIVRAIMKQLLTGVKVIHSKKLIHRDIKGGNILLNCPFGQKRVNCKIADFGLVKVKSGDEISTQMTIAGTDVFMAPELILEDEKENVKADAKVDIWSLGILFYQILTHRFPFNSPMLFSIRQFMDSYSKTNILARPEQIINDSLWDLVTQMLAFDRKDRISASDALIHPFFTSEEALADITDEQRQLASDAQISLQSGNSEITVFDADPQIKLSSNNHYF